MIDYKAICNMEIPPNMELYRLRGDRQRAFLILKKKKIHERVQHRGSVCSTKGACVAPRERCQHQGSVCGTKGACAENTHTITASKNVQSSFTV